MTRFRKDRVAGLIREVISDIVTRRIKDPRVQGVTITQVHMSGDLKAARVYFSCVPDGKADDRRRGMESARGFIRHQLRVELDLKYIPELSFFYDASLDYSQHINTILKEILPGDDTDD